MEIAEKKNRPLHVGILGDSISTYEKFNPIGYDVYYEDNRLKENGFTSVNETWWMQVINEFRGELCINNSYAGSFVLETCEFSISAQQRCCSLHNGKHEPDWILVYGGTNDCLAGINPGNFYESYLRMLDRMKNKYPHAKIFCATLMLGNKEKLPVTNRDCSLLLPYNEAIQRAVKGKQVNLVDLAKYKTYFFSLDGVHPNREGQRLLAEFWSDCLNKICDL